MESSFTRRSFLSTAAAGISLSTLGLSTRHAWADEATTADNQVTWNGLYDVVVIGFGGAGAVTAITAADAGAKVLLVDKAPKGHEGGNTRYCMQVIITIDPEKQADAVSYYKDLRGNKLTPSDELIETWVARVAENNQWLQDMGGNPVPMYDEYPGEYPEYESGGSLIPVTLDGITFDSGFWKFVNQLVMDRADSIDVWYEAPAVKIIRDPQSGIVIGVTVNLDGQDVNIRAKNGVVLTAGGFEANQQMVQDYTGLDECFAMGGQYNTGDGIKMASEIGANLWHMDNIMGPYLQTYYPGASRPEFYSGTIAAANYYTGAFIFVAANGTRFMDESYYPRHGYINYHGTWQHTTTPQPVYLVFDQGCLEQSRFISQSMAVDLSSQVESGVVKQADSIEALAEQIGVAADVLTDTVSRYNEACAAGRDAEFGRPTEKLVAFAESGPYYATELRPAMINSQGGPERNKDAQIIDIHGEPIPHLYGAGECGAIFSGPYQGASNIGDCVAMGRIAGENAATPKDDGQPADDLVIEAVAPEPAPEKTFETGENQYVASAEGICGPVTVRVTVDGDAISSVEVLDSMETDVFGGRAESILPEKFVGLTADQVMDVDTVTLATITSSAIKLAVADAMEQAANA